MAGTTVGSADFLLIVDQGGFVRGFQQAQQTAQRGSAQIAQTIDTNLKKAEQSAQRFGGTFSKALAIGGAITGVTVGLDLIHKGLEKVAEQTQKSAQAQFALNKVYGDGAAQFKAFAQAQAQATGRTATDFEQASVKAATLAKNYGLTTEQIQTLIARSADLAAVHGKELPDAAERVIAAIRGEAEAAEALGLTLNSDAVKAFANMTAEQRKNFESLDQVTKAQIIYNELIRQTNDVQGSAVERANSQIGAFDKLTAATDNLAKAIGDGLAPAFADLAGPIADAINGTAGLIEQFTRLQRLGEGDGLKRITALLLAAAGSPSQLIAQLIAGASAPEPPAPEPGTGPVLGPSPDQVRAAQTQQWAEDKRRAKEMLDQRKEDVAARADAEIKGLEKEKQAAERAHQAKVAAAQKARDGEIKAAEDARDGAIRAIERQAQATADSYERQIKEAERARDAEKQAAEDRRDDALRSLEEVERAAHDANAAQIRDAEIARDRLRQAAEDTRDGALRVLDQEKRARDNARVLEDRAREDETRDVLRAIETQHDAASQALADEAKAAERKRDRKIRAIDAEADRARKAAERVIDGIEDQAQAEDDRHDRVMRGLDAERDARLAILDTQLKALDAQEKAADAAGRMADLQNRAADAQGSLFRAQGSGTPEQIAEARAELTRALRIGDELSIANARDRLKELAGEGADAVKKAQDDLTKALSEIDDERTDSARDAQRQQLEDQRDAIADEYEAKRRAEDEDNKRRKRELDAERDTAQKSLQARLDALDKRKRAADDASRSEIESIRKRQDAEKASHDTAVEQARDVAEQSKRAVEDRRRAEDQADQDKRRQIGETYELEQRQIKATYDDEETGVIPALRRAREAAEREFQARRQAVNDAYDEEQRRLKEVYDGPGGVLEKLREQAETARREYAARKEAVNDAYNAERDRIKEVYDDPESGLFAQLEKSKQKTIDALNDQVEKWRTWKTDVTKEISDALSKLDEFIGRIKELDNIGRVDIRGNAVDQRGSSSGTTNQEGGGTALGGAGQPFRVSFPWDAPYNGAYDGAAWAGGPKRHRGIDLTLPGPNGGKGTPYGAFRDGVVVQHTYDDAGGHGILVQGDDGLFEYYGHNDRILIGGPGTRFRRGDLLGVLGSSGLDNDAQSHLHYEVRRGLNGDRVGETIDPRPYMGGFENAAGAQRMADAAEELVIELFGRQIRLRSKGGSVPGQVGNWIAEGLRVAGLPPEWSFALAQIAAAESGDRNPDGSVVVGTGSATAGNPTLVGGESATGLLQTLPSTFRGYAVPGHTDIYNPVHNAAAAARYIKDRYGSPLNTPYFRNGAFDWRGVDGYAGGTMIREPTLLAGLRTGRLGVAGETGQPERLLGVNETRSYRDGTVGGDTFNYHGVAPDSIFTQFRRDQRRQGILRGASGLLRGH